MHARFLTVALAATLLAGSAYAQAPADPDALVREGIELRKQQHEAEALAVFVRAYAARPSPTIAAQIGLVERALNRWVSAERHLAEALSSKGDPWIETNREQLAFGLATVQKHLGWLYVDANVGAELWVNGARAASLPLDAPLRLPIGEANVEVRAKGYVTDTRHVDVGTGERVHLVVALAPESAPPVVAATPSPAPAPHAAETPAPAPPTSSGSTQRTAGFIVGGAGLLGLGASALFGGVALSKRNALTDPCRESASACKSESDQSNLADSKTYATASTVIGIVGGVATAVGIVLVLTAKSDKRTVHSVVLSPMGFNGGGGIGFSGSWGDRGSTDRLP
jgi:hypothetical protein